MDYRSLGQTGLNVSAMSLGGASIGQQYGPVTLREAEDTILTAMDAGINLIDTSAYYGRGQSEEIIGQVLSHVRGRRDRISICTKAGRLDRNVFNFTSAGMRTSLEASLRRLRTDCVDILLAHDIEFAEDFDLIFSETTEALHQFKKEGKCRYIGMSCYPLSLLREAIKRCQLDVVISYCHFNLQNTKLLTELLPEAIRHGVGVLNASPLAMGLLTNMGPPSWHPAPEYIQSACQHAAQLCQAHESDIAKLGMQFCFSDSRIPSTITGTAHREELDQNLKAMVTPMNTTLLEAVQKALLPVMNKTWPSGNWVDIPNS